MGLLLSFWSFVSLTQVELLSSIESSVSELKDELGNGSHGMGDAQASVDSDGDGGGHVGDGTE